MLVRVGMPASMQASLNGVRFNRGGLFVAAVGLIVSPAVLAVLFTAPAKDGNAHPWMHAHLVTDLALPVRRSSALQRLILCSGCFTIVPGHAFCGLCRGKTCRIYKCVQRAVILGIEGDVTMADDRPGSASCRMPSKHSQRRIGRNPVCQRDR